MNNTIQIERHGSTAVIILNRGTTNAINPELLDDLTASMDDFKDDDSVHSLILTGNNEKFFSIGFDLPAISRMTRENFAGFYETFNRFCIELFTYPLPTIAAMKGHAVAGGCIISLCCDYRYIAEGKKYMGLNEIKLGVPLPHPNDCILKNLVSMQNYRDIMYFGDYYLPEDLYRMGLVDDILPMTELIPRALQQARSLGSLNRAAFRIMKSSKTGPVKKEIMSDLKTREKKFVECWYSDFTQEKIKEALEKF